jgi:Holliday junction DNA helicase RuvB
MELDQDHILDTAEFAEEVGFEESLRPAKFSEYIGQNKAKEGLKIAIGAAKSRKEPIDHVLIYGPPGLGKTTLAKVIANEIGSQIYTTSGPAIERPGDLASILTNLQEGDILFIDEIHRLNRVVEEVLYPAMEDFSLDIMIGKGPGARSVRLDLPKYTLIGATTRTGLISSPLRDRFGLIYNLDFYDKEEIAKIIKRSAKILKVNIDESGTVEIATRARKTPRIANRLLKRVRDFAQVKSKGIITDKIAKAALDLMEVDELGLDNTDRRLLKTIIDNYNGGPVGLSTLAAATSEEVDTIEEVYEPYLIRIGFLERTPRGRKVTPKAYGHFGYNKKGQEQLFKN